MTQIRVTLSVWGLAFAATLVGSLLTGPALAQPNEPEPEPEPELEPEPEPEIEPEPEPEPELEPEIEPELPKPEPRSDAVATVDPPARPGPPRNEPRERTDAEADTPDDGSERTKADFVEAPLEPPGGPIAEDLADRTDDGEHYGSFGFGSYGRVIAATDGTGRPGRNADITAWGSRLDHGNYAELELRRNDYWADTGATTRIVSTLGIGNSIFHYNGEFDAQIAIRNLFIEERDLGLQGLSVWAGSRMLRGDDVYLLDMWPLDNLNTIGGGVQYDAPTDTSVRAHFGVSQPLNPFYKQQQGRAEPLNQFGTATVDILDRVRLIGSLRAQQVFFFSGAKKAGMKVVAYGEAHGVAHGQEESNRPGVFEDVPSDDGFVVGGQIGAFTGERNTHINTWVRYATGLAAYADFANPSGLGPDERASGAHELRIAVSGNYEFGPVTAQAGGYFRTFRNASPGLDFEDVDEGIIIARPHVFFVDWAGLAVEGSFQAQQRGVLVDLDDAAQPTDATDPRPLLAKVSRVGVVPFVSPAGRGSYSRPMIWVIYQATFRDDGARALYPQDDVFNLRSVSHFVGVGAEWWFSSTSYGQNYRYAPR